MPSRVGSASGAGGRCCFGVPVPGQGSGGHWSVQSPDGTASTSQAWGAAAQGTHGSFCCVTAEPELRPGHFSCPAPGIPALVRHRSLIAPDIPELTTSYQDMIAQGCVLPPDEAIQADLSVTNSLLSASVTASLLPLLLALIFLRYPTWVIPPVLELNQDSMD